jgi:hypothetical protein
VSDGADTAHLSFRGAYTLENFKFASDGSGTIVYDPPASASNRPCPASLDQSTTTREPRIGEVASESVIVASGQNPTFSGDDGRDTFIFPSNFGQTAIDKYTPGTNTIQFVYSAFATAAIALAAAYDESHVNVAMVDAAQDTIALHSVAAPLQHHSDFLIM